MITIIWRRRMLSALRSVNRTNLLPEEFGERLTSIDPAGADAIRWFVATFGVVSFEPAANISQMPRPKIASKAK
jgi:hypothetical protein